MTDSQYQIELLNGQGQWLIVGRSKCPVRAEQVAKRAIKACPTCTEYRIVKRK